MVLTRLLSNSGLSSNFGPDGDFSGDVDACLEPSGTPVQRQVRLTPKLIEALAADYKLGRSVRELVEQYGINRGTVRAHLQQQGVPRRPAVRKLTDQDVVLAGQLYTAGDSLATVGRHFGVHGETLRREFKKSGVQVRPRRVTTSN